MSAGYLRTLGVRLIEGRDIADSDRDDTPLVALVNETMARRFWPGESAVGRTFTQPTTGRTFRIVGIVSDHKVHSVLEAPAPYVYFASAQRPSRYNYLLARTDGDPRELLTRMRRELLAMEPGLVFMGNGTMGDYLTMSLLPARVGAWLATGFGALGTLLAAIGLYGVIAFSVSRRTREIGGRRAIGARPASVLGLVLRQGLTLTLAGLIVGGVLAAGASVTLGGLLYGISPLDPLAWTAAIAALLGAALLANLVPARRAMRVDPMKALRTE